MIWKSKYPFVNIPPSKTRIQYINEDSDAYLKDLVPDEALQWAEKLDGRECDWRKRIICVPAKALTEDDLQACLDLVQNTSSADYQNSSTGWSRAKKSKEMQLPDLRYVLLRQSRGGVLWGFMSFMLTFEDGFEVIYLYEVHLRPEMQGLGVGKNMMAIFEGAGRIAEVRKAMLTVFKANEKALRFYEKLGYEEDDYSPRPKKLRSGIVKAPDYLILSKELSKDYDDVEVRRLNKLAERNHSADSLTTPNKKRKAK